MYALEKRTRNVWQRYAVCNRRKPLDKVKKELRGKCWRVVYAFGSVEELRNTEKAA